MTTTRETADNAELLAKLKTNDPTSPAHRLARDLQAGHRLGTEAGNDLIEVLSEIAALRGERDGLRSALDVSNTARLHWELTVVPALADRATQAERQRDELRKALGEAQRRLTATGDFFGARLANEALINQGAE